MYREQRAGCRRAWRHCGSATGCAHRRFGHTQPTDRSCIKTLVEPNATHPNHCAERNRRQTVHIAAFTVWSSRIHFICRSHSGTPPSNRSRRARRCVPVSFGKHRVARRIPQARLPLRIKRPSVRTAIQVSGCSSENGINEKKDWRKMRKGKRTSENFD